MYTFSFSFSFVASAQNRSVLTANAHKLLEQTFGDVASPASDAPRWSSKERQQKQLDDALARLRKPKGGGGGGAPDAAEAAEVERGGAAAKAVPTKTKAQPFNRRGSYFGTYRDPVAKT